MNCFEEYENDKNKCVDRCLFYGPLCPFNDSDKYNKKINSANIKKHGIPWNVTEIEYSKFYIESDSEMDDYEYYIVHSGLKENCHHLVSPHFSAGIVIDWIDLGCPPLNEIDETPTLKHPEKHPECAKYECAVENVQTMKKMVFEKLSSKKIVQLQGIQTTCIRNLKKNKSFNVWNHSM